MEINSNEYRRIWQNPQEILAAIGLGRGFTFIDVGCGDGFFAIPAARQVGRQGRVYGLDHNGEVIIRLRDKAAKEGLTNLDLKVGKAEENVLCEACADMVFFGIVLHDFKDPTRVLTNARIMLKPSGRLINLDWKKETMDIGPPLRIRFSEVEAKDLIEATGFRIEDVQESGQYHYLIMARPKTIDAPVEY